MQQIHQYADHTWLKIWFGLFLWIKRAHKNLVPLISCGLICCGDRWCFCVVLSLLIFVLSEHMECSNDVTVQKKRDIFMIKKRSFGRNEIWFCLKFSLPCLSNIVHSQITWLYLLFTVTIKYHFNHRKDPSLWFQLLLVQTSLVHIHHLEMRRMTTTLHPYSRRVTLTLPIPQTEKLVV